MKQAGGRFCAAIRIPYNVAMARGWESKPVEAQIEAATAERGKAGRRPMSPAEAERFRRREGLSLSRTRVLQELSEARSERYRAMLEAALAKLDGDLAELEGRA